MDWLHILLAFFLANVLGYGGGPSSIPLMSQEIVDHYHWMTPADFSKLLAMANTLPGPISTKIASYVGYDVYGWAGFLIAIAATVLPSAIAMIGLLGLLRRYRQSLAVKGMTLLVQPVIAVMMAALTWQMSRSAASHAGVWQTLGIAAAAFYAMNIRQIQPAWVILAAFIYGGLFLR